MDFGDFFGFTGVEGTRTTRIITGAVGAVAGGGLGYFAAPILGDGGVAPLTGGVMGAVLGGGLGALFSGAVMLALLVVAAVAMAVLWNVYVGGSG